MFKLSKKRIFIILVLALILFTGAIGLTLLNLGKIVNSQKDVIIAQAEEALGRKISVDRIDATIWTGIGVQLDKTAIADDPAFSKDDFLSADRIDVYFKLMPLFRKQLEISYLTIHQPVIHVIQNKKKEFNFTSLQKQTKPKQEGDAAPVEAGASSSTALLLSRLELDGGKILYTNQADKQNLEINQIDATIRNFSLNSPFDISMKSSFQSDRQNIAFQGNIGSLAGELNKCPIKGKIDLESFSTDILKSLPSVKAMAGDSLKYDGVINGEVEVDGTLEKFKLKTQIDATQTSLAMDSQFKKEKDIPLLIAIDADVSKDAVNLQKASVTLKSVEIEGKGIINLGKTLTYNLSIDSKPIEISELVSMVPALQPYSPQGKTTIKAQVEQKGKTPAIKGTIQLDKIQAKSELIPKPITNLNGNIQFTANNAKAEGLTVEIGQSKFKADATVTTLSPLEATYSIQSDKIHVDDLMAPPEAMKNDALQKVNLTGSITQDKKNDYIAKGKVSSKDGLLYNLAYSNLAGDLVFKDQILTSENIVLNTLSGEIKASLQYDMRKSPYQFNLSTQSRDVNLTELIQSQFSFFPKIVQGKINMDLKLQGEGTTWDTIKPVLQGLANVDISEGVLLDTNIVNSVLTNMTGIPGLTQFISPGLRSEYPLVFESKNTIFDKFSLQTIIKDGKMNFSNLVISAVDWAASSNGWIDFDQNVKSENLLKLSDSFSSSLIQKVSQFKYLSDEKGAIVIPFAMTGALPKATVKPDSKLIETLLKKAVMGKVMDQVGGKGLPDLSKIFSSPFGNLNDLGKKTTSDQTKPATKTIQDATQILKTKQDATKAEQASQESAKEIMGSFLKMIDKKKTDAATPDK